MAGKRPDELAELIESGIASDDCLLIWDRTAGILKRFAFSVLLKASDFATQLANHITAGHPQYYTKTETDGRYLQAVDISGLGTGDMLGAHNLSELTDLEQAWTHLGLGSAAGHAHTDYATAAQGGLAATAVQPAALAPYAPLSSPAFTDIPTAPTAPLGTNTAQLATMAALQAALGALVAGAPGALDTLNEIAAQLASDEDAVAALTATVANKQPLDPTLTALAGLVTAADKLIYANGPDSFAPTDLTAFGRTLIALADLPALKILLALSAGDISGLGTAATHAHGDYATAGQGAKADAALPATGGTLAAYTETKGTYTLLSGVLTLNCAGANRFTVTLTASVTSVVLSSLPGTTNAVYPITIKFVQDATGGRTVSGWPAGSKGPGGIGTLPAVTSAANAVDYFVGEVDGGALNISRAWADVK